MVQDLIDKMIVIRSEHPTIYYDEGFLALVTRQRSKSNLNTKTKRVREPLIDLCNFRKQVLEGEKLENIKRSLDSAVLGQINLGQIQCASAGQPDLTTRRVRPPRFPCPDLIVFGLESQEKCRIPGRVRSLLF